MIKAIFFDLGGVLFTNGTKKFIEDLNKRCGISYEKLLMTLDQGIGTDYREGKITRDEFWEKVSKELGLTENIEDLEKEWIAGYKLIEGTKDIVLELSKTYKVYYLSDNVRERIEGINNQYNFFEWFEEGIFSYELGIKKPDPKIYQHALDKAGVKPEEAIFIDDKESNLPPAKELGMTTIWFISPEKLRTDLEKLNVI